MEFQQQFSQWLTQLGVPVSADGPLLALLFVSCLVIVAWVSQIISGTLANVLVAKLSVNQEGPWQRGLAKHRVLHKAARLIPIVVFSWGLPLAGKPWPWLLHITDDILQLWLLVVIAALLFSVLDTAFDAMLNHSLSKRLPLQSMVQLAKLFLVLISIILALSALMDRSPLYLLSGLGVATGLLLLIFRDTILGFVAGLQLSINGMVSRGDWVQIDQFGADGDVLEVSLTTVKVQNWDKTITMIPAYAMVTNAFRNWRGMSESGGRRIKRSLLLDQHSVTFADHNLLEQLAQINLLAPYLESKQAEVALANRDLLNPQQPSNGRRLTNVGCFRAYLVAYLKQHPLVHQNLTLLVRQLAPSAEGLPIEIYCFSNDTRWEQYEDLQADIFDHALAVLPQFGLRTMQQPTGADMRQWVNASVLARTEIENG